MLVGTWLCGIGLDYALPTFEAAGIVTPDALGELNPAHFEALGVHHPDDRRKLFYLVQRVKQQRQQQQQQQDGVQPAAASAMTAPSSKLHSKPHRQPSQQQQHQPQSGEDDNEEEQVDDAENGTSAVNVMFPHHHPNGTSSSRRSVSYGATAAQEHPQPPPRGRLSGVPIPKKRSSSSGGGSTSTNSTSVTGGGLGTAAPLAAAPRGTAVPTTTMAATAAQSGRSGAKPLSTIPSHASAPMSPLVDWTPVEDHDDIDDHDDDHAGVSRRTRPSIGSNNPLRRSTRRAHSVGGEAQPPDNDDIDQATPIRNAVVEAPSLARDNRNIHHTKQTKESRSSSVGLGGARVGRRSTRGQSLQGNVAGNPPPGGNDNNSSAMAVPTKGAGPQQDVSHTTAAAATSSSSSSSSFASQIQRLWEDNARAHGPASLLPPSSPPTAAIIASQRVSVVVRKRPATNDVDVLQCLLPHKLLVYQPRTRVDLRREITALPFQFDAVVSERATNLALYRSVVRPLVPNLLGGQCATVFCFGQTGSGKTHTLFGCRSPSTTTEAPAGGGEEGLYLLAARDVFSTIRALPNFCATAGLFELYDRKVLDLLANRAAVPCWEDATGRVQFPGLSWHDVDCAEELQRLVEQGNALRSTGTTSKNNDSSRSHAVLQLQLDQLQGSPPRATSHPGKKRKRHRYATMTFIDLAGSERGADTALFSNATRMEGAEINTSLLALKEVLRAMSSDSAHIPFRGSKLTQVLKESLVESTSTCVMIACVSPHLSHCEPTLNTLRYAQCLKDFEKSKELGGRTAAQQPQVTLQLPPKPIPHAPQLQSVASPIAKSDAVERDTHSQPQSNASHHIKSKSVHSEVSNDDSALLDEILSSPASAVADDTPPVDLQELRREAAQQLFLTHKDAMTAMLSMVKEEMAIVCHHSGDSADATLQYMEDVKAIQDRQLNYIVKLREHLLQFYEAGDAAMDHSTFHNESFEDLRD